MEDLLWMLAFVAFSAVVVIIVYFSEKTKLEEKERQEYAAYQERVRVRDPVTLKGREAVSLRDGLQYNTTVGRPLTGKSLKKLATVLQRLNGNTSPVFQSPAKAGIRICDKYHEAYWEDTDEWPVRFIFSTLEKFGRLRAIAERYDFELLLEKGGATIALDFYWSNWNLDSVFRCECSISMWFEEESLDVWKTKYTADADVHIDFFDEEKETDERDVLLEISDREMRTISQVEAMAKKMRNAALTGIVDDRVNAPPVLCRETLPRLDGVGDRDVFRIRETDSQGHERIDRICGLRRASFSLPPTKPLEWIDAFSERSKHRKRYKISRLKEIVDGTGADAVPRIKDQTGSEDCASSHR